MPSLLDHPVETLPGVGPATGQRLRARGYESVGDLLWLLPRGYDDQRRTTPIHMLRDGDYCVVEGRVRSVRSFPPGSRLGFEARLAPIESELPSHTDGYRELKLIWFAAIPGLAGRFAEGRRVRVAGRVSDYRGAATIAHPEMLAPEADGSIAPRYPELGGVSRKLLRRAVRAAIDRAAAEVPDLIPPSLRAEAGLSTVGQALRQIHAPDPRELDFEGDGLLGARRRLAIEELVLWELALRLRRASDEGQTAQSFIAAPAVQAACSAFPFELTPSQCRAVGQIGRALESETPMRRLLQGDVGCGKTAVAMVACAQVAAGGGQTAFLAPTELLAEQHAETLSAAAERLGLRLAVITGAVGKARRRALLDRLATGALDVLIGTHALLSGDVRFANLGLVIIDEQHRFGVAQRLRLGSRGPGQRPHLLVMTATPIPRSLALVLYAGLELTTIDEKPPGRLPCTTRMISRRKRATVLRQIERAVAAEGGAFVVCPAICSTDDLVGVDRTLAEMRAHFGDSRVGQVHGRLSTDERRAAMRAFAEGKLDVLVGTTVVEVGVDVPRANIIAVEQADRFGMAQLHQLRGRVGRAGQRSACLLTFEEPLSEDAQARLEALCRTEDGFRLAERDLELRGPGHLFGYRQSGANGLMFADLVRDRELLERAGTLVGRMLSNDPDLSAAEHEAARAAIDRWERNASVREDAG